MALKRIEESLCTGCRVCIESCPMDCIRFNEETGKAYPAFPGIVRFASFASTIARRVLLS